MHGDIPGQGRIAALKLGHRADAGPVLIDPNLPGQGHFLKTPQADIFADPGDERLLGLGQRLPALGEAEQGLDIGRRAGRDRLGHAPREGQEIFIPGHEVGLAIQLQDDHPGAVLVDADDALGRDPAGLRGRFGRPGFAHFPDRRFNIAAGGLQGLFAVHHARARALAQLLDQ